MIIQNVWEPGNYDGGDNCVTVGNSDTWLRVNILSQQVIRTVYVMGSQVNGKWGNLDGVQLFIYDSIADD